MGAYNKGLFLIMMPNNFFLTQNISCNFNKQLLFNDFAEHSQILWNCSYNFVSGVPSIWMRRHKNSSKLLRVVE